MKKNGDEILLMWVEKMLFPDVLKKHMACCKKHKAHILKYMPSIFGYSKCLINKNIQDLLKIR